MGATKFTAVFERDEAGFIYTHVPVLPEVQTQGRTLEDAREMIREAISQAVELRQQRGEPIPAEGWATTELVKVGYAKWRQPDQPLATHDGARIAPELAAGALIRLTDRTASTRGCPRRWLRGAQPGGS